VGREEDEHTYFIMGLHSKRQRKSEDGDSDSETEVRNRASNAGVAAWPRFLVVEGEGEQTLNGLSPFLVNKWFQGVSSGFKTIQRQRSGAFLVECSTRKASDLLLRRDGGSLHDRTIRVKIHAQLNSSKGVIRCADLKDCAEAEIKDELAEQGVTDVRRIFISKEGRCDGRGL